MELFSDGNNFEGVNQCYAIKDCLIEDILINYINAVIKLTKYFSRIFPLRHNLLRS